MTNWVTESSYHNQRRDRLSDVLGDYINDESCDPNQLHRDMLEEVNSWIKYHQEQESRWVEFKHMIAYNITEATKEDWEDFWNSMSEGREFEPQKSKHYYDYDRNDPNRPNPFTKTPDYTEL
tara:strand:- start:537 stop:902 length:366 start_codon:yes stop_codon:yes gene_type:complete